jgi:hypothetical protein
MANATREIHRDDTAMFTGSHDGSNGATVLRDMGASFYLGVSVGQYIENVTQGTSGYVLSYTDNTVTVSGGEVFPLVFPIVFGDSDITWNSGDTYNIYKTSTKNGVISSIWTDRSRGWKVSDQKELNKEGWRPEDWDIDDRGRRKVFSPGYPE